VWQKKQKSEDQQTQEEETPQKGQAQKEVAWPAKGMMT
jgi:hypothetical protein